MKKKSNLPFTLTIVTLVLLFANSETSTSQGFQPLGHLYLHGFSLKENPNGMVSYANAVNTLFPVTFAGHSGTQLPWWSGFPLWLNADTVVRRYMQATPNRRNYVAVGYSAGGVVARTAAGLQGILPNPNPSSGTIVGYISINSPHAGAQFANLGSRVAFSTVSSQHLAAMLLEDRWYLPPGITNGFLLGLAQVVNLFQAVLLYRTLSTLDLEPNSDLLQALASQGQEDREESMDRGRVHVWSRWRVWNYPAAGADNPEQARADWVGSISRVQTKIDDNERWYRHHMGRARWLRFWHWIAATYHRARVSALVTARNGYYGMEHSWNTACGLTNAWSDGFITTTSQNAVSGNKRWEERIFNSNGEEAHGRAGTATPHSTDALRRAMNRLEIWD